MLSSIFLFFFFHYLPTVDLLIEVFKVLLLLTTHWGDLHLRIFPQKSQLNVILNRLIDLFYFLCFTKVLRY